MGGDPFRGGLFQGCTAPPVRWKGRGDKVAPRETWLSHTESTSWTSALAGPSEPPKLQPPGSTGTDSSGEGSSRGLRCGTENTDRNPAVNQLESLTATFLPAPLVTEGAKRNTPLSPDQWMRNGSAFPFTHQHEPLALPTHADRPPAGAAQTAPTPLSKRDWICLLGPGHCVPKARTETLRKEDYDRDWFSVLSDLLRAERTKSVRWCPC